MLFARLRRALRRQDWFAVLLEVAIVVCGVVLGFQVTAWSQAREDAETEQAYLRQVAQDLHETERRIALADAEAARTLDAQFELLRAYRMVARPSRDSVVLWLGRAFSYRSVAPVVGTTEALVSTGDLALIRDDSLRAAFPAYLDRTRARSAAYDRAVALFIEAFLSAQRRVDLVGLRAEFIPPELLDSLAADPANRLPLPAGPRRDPFPLDVGALFTDPDLYADLRLAYVASYNMEGTRRIIAADAARLRDQVEAAIAGE